MGPKQDVVPMTSKDLKFHGCMTLLNRIPMFLMLSIVVKCLLVDNHNTSDAEDES